MVQSFSSLPVTVSERVLCYYANMTDQLQIVRLDSQVGDRFERLIFPKQRLLFEALPQALLEIYAGASRIPLQRILCSQIQVKETLQPSPDAP